ncbi:Crp/Fnr family transcriptional regulator [Erythrobacter sp. THAF29]|uniref:Crp/Fnr family transcriptional regulator n=1 Tax=Erythrobacter sp. THAF29 TaxID=2587851 RepID=UPI0012A92EDD|nr:Crp/Fnr family transcriptional regulator [Erythrobacter sp. THAF29]QFT76139.1 cAMP receptor protein [Erythrobacter sp. THAF29]
MLFSALPSELQERLRADGSPRRFDGGQIIAQRGDEAEGFWLLEEGSVSIGQFLADGEFRAVAVIGPGDSWGELAMFANRPRVVDAVARTRSEVRHIRSQVFEALLLEHPEASRLLLGTLSQQLQELLDVVAGIRRGSAGARVAGILAMMAEGNDLPVRIAISQQELADLLGLTRATVNIALKELEQLSLVRRAYRSIEVLDRERLANIAIG